MAAVATVMLATLEQPLHFGPDRVDDEGLPVLIAKGRDAMELLWILLGILYVACWIFLGLATFRKGHYWLFWIGIIFPILWIVGALINPTPRAAARLAGTA